MILELCNTLALVFLATEVARPAGSERGDYRGERAESVKTRWRFDSNTTRYTLLLTLLANILLSDAWFIAAYNYHWRTAITGLASAFAAPVVWAAERVGGSVLWGAWGGMCTYLLLLARAKKKKRYDEDDATTATELHSTANGLIAIGSGVAITVILRAILHGDLRSDVAHHALPLRLGVSVVVFCACCFYDIRRTTPITPSAFLMEVIMTTPFVFMMFPLVAILIAALMLFMVTIFEVFGADPHRLNGVIYYCTLYGPLGSMYWRVKRGAILQSAGFLPR